jgi:hypothetical protein
MYEAAASAFFRGAVLWLKRVRAQWLAKEWMKVRATSFARALVCPSQHYTAEAIVVSRYNGTRHLRTQAALSKLAANVASNLEAV